MMRKLAIAGGRGMSQTRGGGPRRQGYRLPTAQGARAPTSPSLQSK